MNLDHLDWPFYDDAHRALGHQLVEWARAQSVAEGDDVDVTCRAWVRSLADAGYLRHCVPAAYGGVREALDSRTLCVAREALAYHAALADFAFAMQGLGAGPITLAGSDAARAHWLPRVARGDAIAAFALSEPSAGSDALALTTKAVRDGYGWRLDGCKTWISNGGIADFYCVFARTGADAGAAAISAFVVPANVKGLVIAERIPLMAPHPLARIELDGCRVGRESLLGEVGEGFKLAMRTLDIFRASVAAAANGFARRALDEATRHARQRAMFASTLGEQPVAQAMIGDMSARIDASALLIARAAWKRDVKGARTTREAAAAKLTATESAQQVIDAALQLHGASGLRAGSIVEKLYREIRALRIYEGATEIQRLVIGRDVLKGVH